MEIGIVGYNRPITLLGFRICRIKSEPVYTADRMVSCKKTCISVDGFSFTNPNVYGAFNRMKSPVKTVYLSLILIISIWHCVLKKYL